MLAVACTHFATPATRPRYCKLQRRVQVSCFLQIGCLSIARPGRRLRSVRAVRSGVVPSGRVPPPEGACAGSSASVGYLFGGTVELHDWTSPSGVHRHATVTFCDEEAIEKASRKFSPAWGSIDSHL